jgi:hypothetical protein
MGTVACVQSAIVLKFFALSVNGWTKRSAPVVLRSEPKSARHKTLEAQSPFTFQQWQSPQSALL